MSTDVGVRHWQGALGCGSSIPVGRVTLQAAKQRHVNLLFMPCMRAAVWQCLATWAHMHSPSRASFAAFTPHLICNLHTQAVYGTRKRHRGYPGTLPRRRNTMSSVVQLYGSNACCHKCQYPPMSAGAAAQCPACTRAPRPPPQPSPCVLVQKLQPPPVQHHLT